MKLSVQSVYSEDQCQESEEPGSTQALRPPALHPVRGSRLSSCGPELVRCARGVGAQKENQLLHPAQRAAMCAERGHGDHLTPPIVSTQIHIHTHTQPSTNPMHSYPHTQIHTHKNAHTYRSAHTHTQPSTNTHSQLPTRKYTHIHTNTHTYRSTHTHIHTPLATSPQAPADFSSSNIPRMELRSS